MSRVHLAAALGRQGSTEEAADLLGRVVQRLEPLPALEADGSAELVLAHTLARHELGLLHRKIGDTELAEQELRQAIDAGSRFSRDEPLRHWRTGRVVIDSRLALAEALQFNGDHSGAQGQLELALGEATALSRDDPANATWSRRTAVIHSAAGFGSFLVGDLEAAARSLESAASAFRELMRSDPTRVEWREKLARDLRVLGTVETERGEASTALGTLEEARELLEALVAADPTLVRHRESLARTHWAISLTHLALDRPVLALEAKLASHELLEELWRVAGEDPAPQNELAFSHVAIGDLRSRLGQNERAREDWRRAVELIEPIVARAPETQYLDTYAQALLKLERFEEASEVVQELVGRGWNDPVFLTAVAESPLRADSSP